MNLVWPISLFGTVWVLWLYFAYGRMAMDENAQAADMHREDAPNRMRAPFAVTGFSATGSSPRESRPARTEFRAVRLDSRFRGNDEVSRE